MSLIKKMTVFMLIVSVMAPSAHAFGFGFFNFFGGKPAVDVCENNDELDKRINEYDGVLLSDRILGFLDVRGYQTIRLTVEDKGCDYVYIVTVEEDGRVSIGDEVEDGAKVDFDVSVSYARLLEMDGAYERKDVSGIVSSFLRVKMPWHVRWNVGLFLGTY